MAISQEIITFNGTKAAPRYNSFQKRLLRIRKPPGLPVVNRQGRLGKIRTRKAFLSVLASRALKPQEQAPLIEFADGCWLGSLSYLVVLGAPDAL